MWLGFAAGLALLTWFLARPINARNVSVTDQQLTYEGPGWQLGTGPQVCSDISQTIHTTSTTGDFVTFSFTGSALSVHGPLTTLSTPMTVILDGNIRPMAPPVLGSDGCGTLFTDSNITDSSEQHTLTMVYAAASGSVQYSISGITVVVPDIVSNAAPGISTQLMGMQPSTTNFSGAPTASSSTASSPTASSPTPTTSTSATASSAASTAVMSSAAANKAPPSSASPTQSAVTTTQFVTKPGMTAIIVGAIIGAIIAMLGLLSFFILLRRRITRRSARKMDQETSFGRGDRDLEGGKAKIQGEAGLIPLWNTKQSDSSQFVLEPGLQGLSRNVPTSIPASVTPVSRTAPHQSIGTVYSRGVQSTTSVYTVPFETGRSPTSDVGDDEHTVPERSVAQGTLRPAPPPISIPPNLPVPPNMSSISYSKSLPRTTTTLNPTSAYSAVATAGVRRHGTRGLHVINGSESEESPDLVEAPPGFI